MSRFTARMRRFGWQSLARLPHWFELLIGHKLLMVQGSPIQRANSSFTVFPESRGILGRNFEIGEEGGSRSESVVFPPVRVWRFVAAQVVHNSRFNAVVVDDTLVLPERREPGPWAIYKGKLPRRVGLIHGQSSELVLMKKVKPIQRLSEALFIGTRAPYNWYHWIANVLPALHVANEAKVPRHIPIILPREIQNFPQMIESLEVFLGGRQIAWISQDQVVSVADLYWADSPVFDAPFSQRKSERLPLALHAEAMASYRNRILEYSAPLRNGYEPVSRVFLTRALGAARPYNFEEVEEWARELGFTLCSMDQLSFADQVNLFQGATHIVGPTGAAWSGIMFAQPQLRGLRLHGGATFYENYFSNLATVSGATIYDLTGESGPDVFGEGGFRVRRDDFLRGVHRLLGEK